MGDLLPLLKELTELDGPVGHEGAVADHLERRWAAAGADVRRTPVGNVVAHLGGSGPRLLLQAHMDEINLIVEHVDERGFLSLASCHPGPGTHHLRECLNRRAIVKTATGEVEGVFGCLTGHLRSGTAAADRAPGWEDVFVDLGLPDRDAVLAAGVHPGCPVLYRTETRRLGEHLLMKAADDRVGLAVMTAVAEAADPARLGHDTWLVATVQEEAGAVGAASIRAELGGFDAALAYEVGPASDLPGAGAHGSTVALAHGPCVVHKDTAVHYDAALTRRLVAVADASGIAVQHAVYPRFGTDGSVLMRQGIPTALLAIPTRYTHSPHELVNERDVRDCIRLTQAFIDSTDDSQRRSRLNP